METPTKIDFQGMDPDPGLRGAVGDHVRGLETRFGRITACRVVIEAPTRHHRNGAAYAVHVHLTLPGGHEIAVARTPLSDERRADAAFALNDAFKRARRRLEDRVRRLQGRVKTHAGAPARRSIKTEA
jgi:ribosome-associated translation inhibitor RaiA